MATVYTTNAIVRSRAKNIGASDPSDVEIDEYIIEAEDLVDTMLGFSIKTLGLNPLESFMYL